MKNFRQILTGIDVFPLLTQLQEHPELWNLEDCWIRGPLGGVIYHTDNIVLRYNQSSAPGRGDWDKAAFKILSAAQSIIHDVMRMIPGEHLGKVVITRMPSGDKIDWHTDSMPAGCPVYFQRYQIPLNVRPGVRFCAGDEETQMEPGTAWWFNDQVEHAVFNESGEDRISMLTDIRPHDLSRIY